MDIITTSTQEIPTICLLYEWCNITTIRVLHVWNDVQVKRLVITMIDKNVSYNTITRLLMLTRRISARCAEKTMCC